MRRARKGMAAVRRMAVRGGVHHHPLAAVMRRARRRVAELRADRTERAWRISGKNHLGLG
eukprot:1136474-Pelagomonas_calceolata.AAC.1